MYSEKLKILPGCCLVQVVDHDDLANESDSLREYLFVPYPFPLQGALFVIEARHRRRRHPKEYTDAYGVHVMQNADEYVQSCWLVTDTTISSEVRMEINQRIEAIQQSAGAPNQESIRELRLFIKHQLGHSYDLWKAMSF
jgi:hypothetical protein